MQKQSLNCRISAEWPRLSVFVFDSVSGSVILQYRPLVVHLEEFANQLKNIFRKLFEGKCREQHIALRLNTLKCIKNQLKANATHCSQEM